MEGLERMSLETVYVIMKGQFEPIIEAIFKSKIEAEIELEKLQSEHKWELLYLEEYELRGSDEDSLLMARNEGLARENGF